MREKPEAKIEHKVKIKFEGTGLEHPPKNKAEIFVRQLPIGIDTLTKNINNKITKYFCCSAGTSKTDAQFAANFYDKNEVAQCQFRVDNSDCNTPIKELKYQFRHQISFHIGSHNYVFNNSIAHHNQKGLGAKEKGEFQGQIDLRGNAAKLIPGNNSKMIRSHHYQCIELSYDSSCICDKMPTVELPTTIIENKHMPPFAGFVPPMGNIPMDLGMFNLEVKDYLADD